MERPLDDVPVTDLVKEAYRDLGDLVRVEVALAWRDARDDLRDAKRAALLAVAGFAAAVLTLSMLVVAAVLACSDPVRAALVAAGIGAALTAALWIFAARSLPRAPFAATRARLEQGAKQLKETLT